MTQHTTGIQTRRPSYKYDTSDDDEESRAASTSTNQTSGTNRLQGIHVLSPASSVANIKSQHEATHPSSKNQSNKTMNSQDLVYFRQWGNAEVSTTIPPWSRQQDPEEQEDDDEQNLLFCCCYLSRWKVVVIALLVLSLTFLSGFLLGGRYLDLSNDSNN
jgi:hypothetical protein